MRLIRQSALPRIATTALVLAAAVLSGAPAQAQRGWGPGWGDGWGRGPGLNEAASRRGGSDSREGRVAADRFVADGAAAVLGHGAMAVTGGPGSSGDGREAATFEAAVVDQLAKSGYDTARPDPQGGQVTEVVVVRDMVAPAEEKRSPVSGSMEVGVSNRGSMMGLQLNYDATKPRGALIETRLEARIRDRASGKLLWEGHAEMVTREGDSHWTENAVAGRLAGALFDRFPAASSLAER